MRIIRGEPERAPNTRGTGSGFICMYVCGVIISVRRELNLGNGRHVHARTPALHHQSERQLECRQGIKLGKVSAVPLW